MKRTLLLLIGMFFANASYAQFTLEHTYDTNIVHRTALQDNSVIYYHINKDYTNLVITDKEHEILYDAPLPDCNGYYSIISIRNDYDFGTGTQCLCQDSSTLQHFHYLIDGFGNIQKEFSDFTSIDEDYVIEFDQKSFSTNVYDTKSLDLVKTLENIHLKSPSHFSDDAALLLGHNQSDSIFLFDKSLEKVHSLYHNIGPDIPEKVIINHATNSINDSIYNYFIVNRVNLGTTSLEFDYNILDLNGNTVFTVKSPTVQLHKHNNELQVLYQPIGSRLSSYSITRDTTLNILGNQNISEAHYYANSPILASAYYTNGSIIYGYDYLGNVSFSIPIEDANYNFGFNRFKDTKGNKYHSYHQSNIGEPNNVVIFRNGEFLQNLSKKNGVIVSEIENHPVKLLTFGGSDHYGIEVYGLSETTQTKELKKQLTIGPNPTTDKIYISDLDSYDQVNLYDMTNKLLTNYEINKSASYIDVSTLQDGTYILSLQTKNGITHSTKIIKTN